MKGILAAVAAVVVLGVAAAQDKKFDAAKLVGKWELVKAGDPELPKGMLVEFTKDNKVNVSGEAKGEKFTYSGTYKVDGDKLTVKLNLGDGKDNEDTDTIVSLTDDKFVIKDKSNRENEFSKKK